MPLATSYIQNFPEIYGTAALASVAIPLTILTDGSRAAGYAIDSYVRRARPGRSRTTICRCR